MLQHLWLEEEGRLARGLILREDELQLDRTIDASVFGAFYFGIFGADTAVVDETMRAVRDALWVQTEVGGIARYESDQYQRVADIDDLPGNPWVICTLWLAEHAIARATTVAELQSALDLLRWARSKARPSLVLPEQVHPLTGAPLSVAPFSWSHAQVISVVRGYLDSLRFFRRNTIEKSSQHDVKNAQDNPVDKPTSFT
jgi:GH15 family glucan-1,4-alpha-glucosidase